jgi:hypothetical protein
VPPPSLRAVILDLTRTSATLDRTENEMPGRVFDFDDDSLGIEIKFHILD